jgi:hypothetical protein
MLCTYRSISDEEGVGAALLQRCFNLHKLHIVLYEYVK